MLRLRPLPEHLMAGRAGESAAAKYLASQGYTILARNFKTRAGEADLVVSTPCGGVFALVEVKARTLTGDSKPFGGIAAPEAAVDSEKHRRLRAIARHLAQANTWPLSAVRIDIVAVDLAAGGPVEIRHYPGALPVVHRG
ncbi:MAG: YraN family protein [Phycisphaerales bacterium]